MHLALKSVYLLGYSGLFVAGKDAVNANALLLFTVVVNPRYHFLYFNKSKKYNVVLILLLAKIILHLFNILFQIPSLRVIPATGDEIRHGISYRSVIIINLKQIQNTGISLLI